MNNVYQSAKPQDPLDETEDSMSLPPRSTLHPSNPMRVVRIFYRSLIFLFVILMVGLTLWGMKLAG